MPIKETGHQAIAFQITFLRECLRFSRNALICSIRMLSARMIKHSDNQWDWLPPRGNECVLVKTLRKYNRSIIYVAV